MQAIVITISLTLYSLIPISGTYNPDKAIPPNVQATEQEVWLKWKLMEKSMQDGISKIMEQVTQGSMGSDVQLNAKCMSDLMKVISGVSQLKLWAIRLLDSMGKPGSGLLTGTLSALGNYDECLDIEFPQSEKSKFKGLAPTRGQYCMMEIQTPVPPRPKLINLGSNPFKNDNSTFDTEVMNALKDTAFALYTNGFRIGLCIPSTCKETDLKQMIDAGLNNSQATTRGNVYSCETRDSVKIDTVQIIIAGFLVTFVLVVILCTILDLTVADSKSIGRELISAFSIHRNFITTFKIKESSGHMLESLNGLRVMSLMWVVLGHNYVFFEHLTIRNALDLKTIHEDVFMQPIINCYPAVQTFLAISGVLTSYNLVKAFDSKGISVLNLPVLVFRRIWRLLPPMLLLIGVGILLPLLGSGPLYQDFATMYSDNCRSNWWYYVLFIENSLDQMHSCFTHTWYIATDFQLFLFAMVYFVLFFRWAFIGKFYLALLFVGSILTTAAVTYFWNLSPTFIAMIAEIDFNSLYIRILYAAFYTHLGAYVSPLALGTFMARREKMNIPKVVVILGWLVSITVILTVFYGVLPWNSDRLPTTLESVMYGALYRPVFALCICWFILACGYGYSGFLGQVLSWNGLQPLAKLSYVAYIAHLPIHLYKIASIKGHTDYDQTTMVWTFFATFGLSILTAAIIRVLFEGTLLELDRIFISWLNRNNLKEQKEESVVKNNIENSTSS